MVKNFFILCLIFSSAVVFADNASSPPLVHFTGVTSFFEIVLGYFNSFYDFIFSDIPAAIDRFFVWLLSYYVYLKLYSMYRFIVFYHDVALSLIDTLDLTNVVNSSISALPSDIRQTLIDCRVFDALSLLIEAFITRIVFSMSN